MKERKTKSKFLIIMLTCMIALSSVWAGRTYAYFSASNNASGTITMGTLKVNNFGELDASTSLKVVPNQTVTKNFKATIESDIKYYKRLSLSATVDVATGKSHDSTCGDYVDDDTAILNATIQGFEKYTADDDSIYYYSLAPVTPDDSNLTDENFTVNLAIHDWVGAGGCDYYMGATINIGVKIEVIQADYLESDTTGTTYSSVDEMHNVWTGINETVQDVSEYPELEFSVLSTSARTMSVKQATTSTASLSVDDVTPVASGLKKINTKNVSATEESVLTIPAKVKKDGATYTVTEIPDGDYSTGAFYKSTYTKIILPNTLTKIGKYAFHYSSLTSINIPNGVTSIKEDTFFGCSSLTSINIPNSVTSIGNDAFGNCSNLTSINIPNGVTSIGDYAFGGCSNLTSINIPNGVTSIKEDTFLYCSSLTSINVDSNNENYCSIDGVLFSNDKTKLVCYPKGKTDTNYAIPNSVISIGDYAFYGCLGLTSTTIPDSVTSIGDYAFVYCLNLTSITIPNSVTSIGESAFNSAGLTSITIPSSVTSMGRSVFANCESLDTATINSSVIRDGSFAYCSNLKTVTIGSNVNRINRFIFVECSNLSSVTFENTTGWYKTDSSDFTGGISIGVTYSSANATNMKSTSGTLCGKCLYRVDA